MLKSLSCISLNIFNYLQHENEEIVCIIYICARVVVQWIGSQSIGCWYLLVQKVSLKYQFDIVAAHNF